MAALELRAFIAVVNWVTIGLGEAGNGRPYAIVISATVIALQSTNRGAEPFSATTVA